ncbi:hypothetical protein FA95DRAFT_1602191 [Auriscalpium vulgare]|uniref:Uncharacterized protein n=1 Tax=Auriscalpium vulgare TaxID=40419 RepID=A0ACB8S6G5_9AGAM|nr:hypothetical protein FA95DRAFT_1602191 [Auriscalpium vulgare]
MALVQNPITFLLEDLTLNQLFELWVSDPALDCDPPLYVALADDEIGADNSDSQFIDINPPLPLSSLYAPLADDEVGADNSDSQSIAIHSPLPLSSAWVEPRLARPPAPAPQAHTTICIPQWYQLRERFRQLTVDGSSCTFFPHYYPYAYPFTFRAVSADIAVYHIYCPFLGGTDAGDGTCLGNARLELWAGPGGAQRRHHTDEVSVYGVFGFPTGEAEMPWYHCAAFLWVSIR